MGRMNTEHDNDRPQPVVVLENVNAENACIESNHISGDRL